MSAATIRLALGISVWAAALLGALSIANIKADWGHGVCGVWGCGPPLQSLVACHLAWLVVMAPPAVMLMRSPRIPAWFRRRIGGLLLLVATIGLVAIVVGQRIQWWPSASDWQRSFFWQRCGFVLVTAIDLPLLQSLGLGSMLLGNHRSTATRVPRSAPHPEASNAGSQTTAN